MHQLTQEQAIHVGESELWRDLTYRQRAEMQMSQEYLCMDFKVFHEALEKTLGRPVFTHELGLNPDGIKAELFDGAEPPSLKEIMEMVPEEKRIVVEAE